MKRSEIRLKRFRHIILAVAPVLVACFCVPGEASGYDSSGRRDPFVPLVGVYAEGAKEGVWSILTIDDVRLQGIVVDPDGKRSVVINGEVMEEGEKIERVTIESIGDNVVKIKIENQRFELKLYE